MIMSERPYSIVLCLTEENKEVRSRIIDYFNFHMHSEASGIDFER
jgi:hypothetical protein